MDRYGYFDRQGNPISLETWAGLWGQHEYRFVLNTRRAETWVITIWDGMDPYGMSDPVDIFETTLFRRSSSGGVRLGADKALWSAETVERHATEDEALRYHRSLVENVSDVR